MLIETPVTFNDHFSTFQLNTGRNGCTHVKHVLFPKLRRIAEANDDEEYEVALEDLQTCRAWEDSKKFQSYFKNEWLDKHQVCELTLYTVVIFNK